jgi:hypothetical protein
MKLSTKGILVDSSAWIEFFRKKGSKISVSVSDLLEKDEVLITEIMGLPVLVWVIFSCFETIKVL